MNAGDYHANQTANEPDSKREPRLADRFIDSSEYLRREQFCAGEKQCAGKCRDEPDTNRFTNWGEAERICGNDIERVPDCH